MMIERWFCTANGWWFVHPVDDGCRSWNIAQIGRLDFSNYDGNAHDDVVQPVARIFHRARSARHGFVFLEAGGIASVINGPGVAERCLFELIGANGILHLSTVAPVPGVFDASSLHRIFLRLHADRVQLNGVEVCK